MGHRSVDRVTGQVIGKLPAPASDCFVMDRRGTEDFWLFSAPNPLCEEIYQYRCERVRINIMPLTF